MHTHWRPHFSFYWWDMAIVFRESDNIATWILISTGTSVEITTAMDILLLMVGFWMVPINIGGINLAIHIWNRNAVRPEPHRSHLSATTKSGICHCMDWIVGFWSGNDRNFKHYTKNSSPYCDSIAYVPRKSADRFRKHLTLLVRLTGSRSLFMSLRLLYLYTMTVV